MTNENIDKDLSSAPNTNKKFEVHVVKYRVLWMCLSALLLIPGIVAMIYSMITYPNHSPLKVGIDYTGGTIMQYEVDGNLSHSEAGKLKTVLNDEGITSAYIQILKNSSSVSSKADEQNASSDGQKSIISVRTKFIDEKSEDAQKISEVVTKNYDGAELVQVSSVGPTLSKELFKNSFIALIVAILGMIMYISFRFELKYAVSAIAGLIHDVTFVLGVFSLLGLFFNVEVDGLFLTAILTVIGYSVNDTIVTYDRIRENLRYYGKKMTYGEIVDASVQQVMTRSINTSMTTFLALASLYFFGGVSTKDFVLAMMLGVLIGTYSSIFFCSMLVDFWTERKNAPRRMAVE